MEPELEALTGRSKNIVPIVVSSVLVAALVAGGGVYAYQKSQNDKAQSDLQSQITSLQQEIAASKTAVATPTPTLTATPIATVSPAQSTATPTPSTASLTMNDLLNGTYNTVTYTNGTKTTVGTSGMDTGSTFVFTVEQSLIAQGDINNDSVADAAVVTSSYGYPTGGSSTQAKANKKYILNVVTNNNGKPANPSVSTADLQYDAGAKGSIQLNSISIKNESVVAVVSSSQLSPSQRTLTYKLVGDKLTLQ